MSGYSNCTWHYFVIYYYFPITAAPKCFIPWLLFHTKSPYTHLMQSGVHSAFQFIPMVFGRVEVRALCGSFEFLHSNPGTLCLHEACIVYRVIGMLEQVRSPVITSRDTYKKISILINADNSSLMGLVVRLYGNILRKNRIWMWCKLYTYFPPYSVFNLDSTRCFDSKFGAYQYFKRF